MVPPHPAGPSTSVRGGGQILGVREFDELAARRHHRTHRLRRVFWHSQGGRPNSLASHGTNAAGSIVPCSASCDERMAPTSGPLRPRPVGTAMLWATGGRPTVDDPIRQIPTNPPTSNNNA